MKIESYPPQEPFTEIGARYHERVLGMQTPSEGKELQYGDNPYQSIAIFPADTPNGNVLCFMHGGGWTNGYKEWMNFMAPSVNGCNATFVSIGYRLAPHYLYPTGFEDCCDALETVFGNIADFGGDPGQLFIGGHSAGGHYAALMGLRTDWISRRNLPGDLVKGVLPVSGTFEFGEGSGLSMRPRFLGPPEMGHDKTASPINHLHSGAPPFLVAWGEKDFPHLARQGEDFAKALLSHNIDVTTLILKDCDHLGASYAAGEIDGAWISSATKFMKSHTDEPNKW